MDQVRDTTARAVNSVLVLLYWSVGDRIRHDILKQKRADYGKQIVGALSRGLGAEHGKGFTDGNLLRMIQLAEVFPDREIVGTLSRQSGWSHFVLILPVKDDLRREFYAEMCRVERIRSITARAIVGMCCFGILNLFAVGRADGRAYNGSIWQGYFADVGPIVDGPHVVCDRYSAARAAGADESSGGAQGVAWACRGGRVAEVRVELEAWPARVGLPPPGEPVTAEDRRDVRRVVAAAIRYSHHNRGRMDDPRYRREGLPTTRRRVESLVGPFNARVKAKNTYRTDPAGAETLLQLRAAVLREDDRLDRFLADRPVCSTRERPAHNNNIYQKPNQNAA
ncbi:MAG TPA: DUF1016 N-terminal domain-containing protein [Urbifossiella sp.]|nr:DUF1016 N-terminal domain-containing protein [Urbifossiella sp.]